MASYATLAELKTQLGISGTGEDALLQQLLDAATTAIDNHTNTTFASTAETETLDGDGSRYLQLGRRPVVSVASVSLDDAAVSSDDYEIQADRGFLVFPEPTEYNPRTRISGNIWSLGDQNIDVTYNYGYTAVPDPVWLACLKLATYYYHSAGREGIQSERMGPRSIAYGGVTGGLPPDIAGMIKAYRQEGVVG